MLCLPGESADGAGEASCREGRVLRCQVTREEPRRPRRVCDCETESVVACLVYNEDSNLPNFQVFVPFREVHPSSARRDLAGWCSEEQERRRQGPQGVIKAAGRITTT